MSTTILSAKERTTASTILDGIIEKALITASESKRKPATAVVDISLFQGATAAAVFLAHAARALGRPSLGDMSVGVLNRCVEHCSVADGLPHGLYFGAAGVGWAVEHVNICLGATQEAYVQSAALDDALLEMMNGSTSDWEGHHDLLNGLVGIGIYALSAIARPTGRELLRRVVHVLEKTAYVPTRGRTVWLTRGKSTFQAAKYIDLGMANGLPAVVSLLAAAVLTGVCEDAVDLLASSVAYLRERELPTDAAARYPLACGNGQEAEPSCLGWCYGDAVVAYSLLAAATALGDVDLRGVGERIASAASRSLRIQHAALPLLRSNNLVLADVSLCHGAFGISHLFTVINELAPTRDLEVAASDWLIRGIKWRTNAVELGDLSFIDERWIEHLGFLRGLLGVGLVLLHALFGDPPDWDELLLPGVRILRSLAPPRPETIA